MISQPRSSSKEAAHRLIQLVQDAARQRLFLEFHKDDKDFERAGGNIIYSIDTNIIKLYLDPVKNAPIRTKSSKRRPLTYAQVFSNDPEELAIALGTSISFFLFFKLGADHSLVLSPHLESEFSSIFNRLVVDASNEHRHIKQEVRDSKKLIELLTDRLDKESDPNRQIDLIIERLPSLRAFLSGERGPSAELNRLALLTETNHLKSVERLQADLMSDDLSAAIRRPSTVMDWIYIADSQPDWEARIRIQNPQRPARRIENDAKTVIWVQNANEAVKNTRYRVLHITGDQALFEAAETYDVSENGTSFASLYLRHPRSFLAEPSVLFASEPKDNDAIRHEEFIEWLDVFLADFMDCSGNIRKQLMELQKKTEDELYESAHRVLTVDPQAADEVTERWHSFCGPLTVTYLQRINAKAGDSVRHGADPSATAIDRVLTRLHDLVECRVKETWSRCFCAATQSGFSLMEGEFTGATLPHRSPLPITFDRLHVANDFLRNVQASRQNKNIPKINYRAEMEKIEAEDSSGYLFYICFAALFLAENKWQAGKILTERAIAIAESLRCEATSRISGREAYFQRAYEERLLSTNREGFQNARKFLGRAFEAFQYDKATFPELRTSPLRLDVETVSIDLAEILFNRFGQRHVESNDPASDIRRLESILQDITKIDSRAHLEENEYVRNSCRRRLLVNFFTAWLLLPKDSGIGAVNREILILKRQQLFDSMYSNRSESSERSYLHLSVYYATEYVLESLTGKGLSSKFRKEVEHHFSDHQVQKHLVTSYDEARYKYLRELCR